MRVPIKAEKGQAVDSPLLTPAVWPSETHVRYPANTLPWGYLAWSLDAACLGREGDRGGGSSPVDSNSQSWLSRIPEAEGMCLSPQGGIWAAHHSVHFRSVPPSLSSIGNASPGPPRYKKKKRRHTGGETQRHTKKAMWRQSRDWTYAATCPRTPGPPEVEKPRKDCPLEPLEGAWTHGNLELGLWSPELWKNVNFCCFKPPSLQRFFYGSSRQLIQ